MKHLPLLRRSVLLAAICLAPAGEHAVAQPSQQPHAARPDAAALAAQQLRDQVGLAAFTAPDFRPGTVKHMVMFELRPGATDAQRKMVVQEFLDLARLSRRPNGSTVVQSIETGLQDSGEGVDRGLQLGFLVTFKSQGDRNFYVGRPIVNDPAFFDAAHERYKQKVGALLQQVVVFDFPVSATTTLAAFSGGHPSR
ncbi:Dabb family protein [Acetobacter sacchari]|uniref:Dabb family protein n=1 Tax=Acetobacter sacchari TaxID=2661687 RepID=A0ABS3M1R0_9PROT|nr:Dabb family protein [Acetobacter sacchari]MBO1362045.1 Dabb family protein [Acetobacter sacchari]